MESPLYTALVLSCFCCIEAQAGDWQWRPGAALAWTSDYVLRGISQSDNRPALQASIDIEPLPQWTLGAWASTVWLLPEHHATELNVYVGKQWAVNQDLSLELNLVHYSYINDPRPISYTYNELNAAINWLDTWLLRVSWSPDTSFVALPYGVKTGQQTAVLETGYHGILPYAFELLLGAGYYAPLQQHEGGYSFGNAGIARKVGPLRAELNWFWAQNSLHRVYTPGPTGGPWALTVIWSF